MDFERSFGDFIDRREYDRAENALFSMVRIAFRAGWISAGGNPPKPQKVLELKRKNVIDICSADSIQSDIIFEGDAVLNPD